MWESRAALMISLAALLFAMSGAAIALEGKNSVSANDIRRNAVRSQEVKDKTLRGSDLADGSIDSQQIAADSLDPGDLSSFAIADDSLTRVLATEAAGIGAAQAAAPRTVLYEEGELSVYAKCFRDSAAGELRGEIYAESATDGALLAGGDDLPADPAGAELLRAVTPEEDRELDVEVVSAPDQAAFDVADGALAGADGTSFRLVSSIAVKQGNLPAAEGAFGDGNACLFGLEITG